MESKPQFLTPIIFAVVAAALAGWIGYSAGLNGARAGAALPGMLPPPDGVRDIIGTVKGVSGSEISMDANQLPFAPKAPLKRTVIVDENTVIERLIEKDADTQRKEMNDFIEKSRKAAESNGPGPAILPPLPFDRREVSISDVKAGDVIMASAGEDITNAKSFTAARISIQIEAAVPQTLVSPEE